VPGRLLTVTAAEIGEHFAAAGAAAAGPEAAPGQMLPAVLSRDGRRRVAAMRWGLIPMGRVNARGRPVLETIANARSETLFAKSAFAGLGRCIVPAAGWVEWTAERRRKVRWVIRAPDRILAIAAVWDGWRAPGRGEVLSLATVTCAPTPAVATVHDRMPAILEPGDWAGWLGEVPADPAALLRPFAGRLAVEREDRAG
jgi:putative SOS response-associated peptidase YedK